MYSSIKFGVDAKEKLVKGINTLADAVSITLGAKGRLVAIAKADPKGNVFDRKAIDDGVGVARAIDIRDEYENMGAFILKEAAQKQVDEVGDGTTATIVLARAIVLESMKQIAEGKNPTIVRKELEEGLKKLLLEIDKHKTSLKKKDDKVRVANISCKDEVLGQLIADTFEKVGEDGVITVEESKSTETLVEHQQGMQFDRGYVSPYFITDPATMRATFENSPILFTDISVSNFNDLVPFLTEFIKTNQFITIIAPDFGGDALPSLIQNKLDGKLFSLCINAPSFGDNQLAMLEDMAILTGGKVISSKTGKTLKDVKLEDLGYAELINSTKDATVISGGKGDRGVLANRIGNIRALIASETNEFNLEKLKERLGKLSNGVSVIRVGGQTEIEMRERKERVIDAVAATRSAIKSGVVAGGEIIYLAIRDKVKDNTILYNALKKPFYQLLENSGIDLAETGFDLVNIKKNIGIDVLDSKVKDMIEAGIIDPVEIPRQALKNAISVAIQILMIGAVIVPDYEVPKV